MSAFKDWEDERIPIMQTEKMHEALVAFVRAERRAAWNGALDKAALECGLVVHAQDIGAGVHTWRDKYGLLRSKVGLPTHDRDGAVVTEDVSPTDLLKRFVALEAEFGGDNEVLHGALDDWLVVTLRSLGYHDAMDAYEKIEKWYA